MSKFCPLVNEKVVYLDCLECDNKICKGGKPMEDDWDEWEENQAKCGNCIWHRYGCQNPDSASYEEDTDDEDSCVMFEQ